MSVAEKIGWYWSQMGMLVRFKSRQIDLQGDGFTFGHRIRLSEIFASDVSDAEKFYQTFECLHECRPPRIRMIPALDYFSRIIEGLCFWAEREMVGLQHDPTPEEIQAGIEQFAQNIGNMGTIMALAKAYGKDPDEILGWSYPKVFRILYANLEEFKFNTRFNKVIERKYAHPRR